MSYKKLLTIQDISCVGQCSLTVALPIISACGIETAVLPSAVLSTHTMGFTGYTFRDLTEDMPAVMKHWQKEGILFDAVYTGYLGSEKQIAYVSDIISACAREDAPIIIDPAMADNGKMYPGFDAAFVESMKNLCAKADYLVPNITEACYLTGIRYQTEYDRSYAESLAGALLALGAKNIILTGVSLAPGKTGVWVQEGKSARYYEHELLKDGCHGTGDIYASAFSGALLRGKCAYESAKIAADYVVECIRYSASIPNHKYGAAFEPVLGKLIESINN